MKKHQQNRMNIKGGMLFMLFMLLLNNIVIAQSGIAANSRAFYSPGGLLDTVIDGHGHKYSLGEISTDETVRSRARGGSSYAPIAPGCTAGYFRLFYDAGSGFNDADAPGSPEPANRRAVLCQVLTDISAFIESPLTVSGQHVNIWVTPEVTGVLGEGSPFFNFPHSATVSGIADNAAWITINSGRDAFEGVTSPLTTSGGGSVASTHFHASIHFNWGTVGPAINWNTSLTGTPGTGQVDLYTVALHEMLHVLGFHSLIEFHMPTLSARSLFGTGYTYFSRYDMHLQQPSSSTHLITNGGLACGMYQWIYNPAPALTIPFIAIAPGSCVGGGADHTIPGHELEFAGSGFAAHVPVYTPNCFERGSSLSHFEDEYLAPSHPFMLAHPGITVPNNQYYLVSNAGQAGPWPANPGSMKRAPTPEERSALCDIGYRVRYTYGTLLFHSDRTYTGGICGETVAGINDGITPGVGYTYISVGSVAVGLNNALGFTGSILDNDHANGFKCLEEIIGNGTAPGTFPDGTVGTSATPIRYIPGPGAHGVQLLRYTPISATGTEGNITYIYVYVPDAGCMASPCNLVTNGGFENVDPGHPPGAGLPGMHCWYEFHSSDLYASGVPGRYHIPGTFSSHFLYTDVHDAPTLINNHFIGMGGGPITPADFGLEYIAQPLQSSLSPGVQYTLSFWAKLANNPLTGFSTTATHLQFAVSDLLPVTAVECPRVTPGFPASPNLNPLIDVLLDAQTDNQWHHYTATFVYPPGGIVTNTLTIFQAPWLDLVPIDHYVILDDVSLVPTVSLPTFTPPVTMCINGPIVDLNHFVSALPATFRWESTPVLGGVTPTIETDHMFDPLRAYNASIAMGGNGLVFVSYTYTDVLGCERIITARINILPEPDAFIVTGGGSYCPGGPGVHVGLSGSTVGVNYQLHLGTIPVGTPMAGTGAPLDFGLHTAPGVYTVVAINTATTCSHSMTGSVTILVYPTPSLHAVTGGGGYCLGGTGLAVGLAGSQVGVNYQLLIGGIPTGGPVSGTGAAISFGLQTVAGTYTVLATNTTTTCTSAMTGSVVVSIITEPTFTVTGGGGYCAGGIGLPVGLSGSVVGTNYRLFWGALAIGAPVPGTGSALSFGMHTAPGVYTAVATNPATTCVRTMTGSVSIFINPLPVLYAVTGGGSSCMGVHVGLSGSVVGINYQLYRGGTAVGAPVAGTGIAIDFGLQTVSGTFTVVAANPSTGCTSNMSGSATVEIETAPLTLFLVTGGGHYCSGGAGIHVGLNSSTSGISYQLYNGSLLSGAAITGTGTSLDFGLKTAAGIYTVIATDLATGCSRTMTGSATIFVDPLPVAYTVTGGGGYCAGDAGVHIGLGNSDIGIDYQLLMGTTAIGSLLPGTGSPLDFGLYTVGGTYTVVGTNTTTGCTNSMTGSVTITINPLPSLFTVTGGGSYCLGGTGVIVSLSGSVPGVNYQLYLGSVAIGTPLAGTGAALSFGSHATAGTYTVVATNTATGCTSTMTGSAVIAINPLPLTYTVVGGGSYCAGGTGVFVGLSNSQTGVNYQLYVGGIATGTPVAGTGALLGFGLQTVAGIYTVIATNTTTTCTRTMTGSVTIAINPLPSAFAVTGGGSYCAGGTGVVVGLFNSQSGVNYQLLIGGSPTGSPVAGIGSAISFGLQNHGGCLYRSLPPTQQLVV
jgi:hypothetical protein